MQDGAYPKNINGMPVPGFHKVPASWRWLQRIKQSRGHGVHSPFAFDLITNIIHSRHTFYAFSDIRETLLKNGFDTDSIARFNYLSFRLVHYLQAKEILEINSGLGGNTLFLTAPSSHISCRCVEADDAKIAVAKHLLKQMGRHCEIQPSLFAREEVRYDAIFVNLEGSYTPDTGTLVDLSHDGAFWVFHPIHKDPGKQFWSKIVHDMNVRMAFDVKETGIVFLHPTFYKKYYFV